MKILLYFKLISRMLSEVPSWALTIDGISSTSYEFGEDRTEVVRKMIIESLHVIQLVVEFGWQLSTSRGGLGRYESSLSYFLDFDSPEDHPEDIEIFLENEIGDVNIETLSMLLDMTRQELITFACHFYIQVASMDVQVHHPKK